VLKLFGFSTVDIFTHNTSHTSHAVATHPSLFHEPLIVLRIVFVQHVAYFLFLCLSRFRLLINMHAMSVHVNFVYD